jgi:hypothetical protein
MGQGRAIASTGNAARSDETRFEARLLARFDCPRFGPGRSSDCMEFTRPLSSFSSEISREFVRPDEEGDLGALADGGGGSLSSSRSFNASTRTSRELVPQAG